MLKLLHLTSTLWSLKSHLGCIAQKGVTQPIHKWQGSGSVEQMVQNQTWLSSQVHSGCFASRKAEGKEAAEQQLPSSSLPGRRPRQLPGNKESADRTA